MNCLIQIILIYLIWNCIEALVLKFYWNDWNEIELTDIFLNFIKNMLFVIFKILISMPGYDNKSLTSSTLPVSTAVWSAVV